MNCPRCNTYNEEGAKFCRNCGMELTNNQPVANNTAKQSMIFLLVIMSWDYFVWLIWFVVQKLVVPKISKHYYPSYEKINAIYKTTGWTVDSLSILLLIIFSILVKNNTVRIFLIIFAVIRIGLLLVYRVFN